MRTPREDVSVAIMILTNVAGLAKDSNIEDAQTPPTDIAARAELSQLRELKDRLNWLRYRVINRINDITQLLTEEEL